MKCLAIVALEYYTFLKNKEWDKGVVWYGFFKLQYMVFLLMFIVIDIVYVSFFAVLLTNVSDKCVCCGNAQITLTAWKIKNVIKLEIGKIITFTNVCNMMP